LISAVMQGGLVRRLVPRLGEVRLIRMCGVPFIAGLAFIALAPGPGWLLVALALLAFGFGGTLPSVYSLISQVAPEALQGGVLGVGQSVGSAARIVGPVLAGWAFDALGIASPYFLGAGVATCALLLAFFVQQPVRPELPPGRETAVPLGP